MANGVFNIAKGRVQQYADNVEQNSPAGCELVLILMEANETESTLIDRDSINAVFAEAGSTEATFASYARIDLVAADLTVTTDDSGDTAFYTSADKTWSSATTGTTLTKLIVAYDPTGSSADTNLIPLTHHDFSATTNGSDLTADFGTKIFEAS